MILFANVSLQNGHMLVDFSHVSVYYFYLFLINVGVQANLRAFRLITRALKLMTM
jgi:hypothetical protein